METLAAQLSNPRLAMYVRHEQDKIRRSICRYKDGKQRVLHRILQQRLARDRCRSALLRRANAKKRLRELRARLRKKSLAKAAKEKAKEGTKGAIPVADGAEAPGPPFKAEGLPCPTAASLGATAAKAYTEQCKKARRQALAYYRSTFAADPLAGRPEGDKLYWEAFCRWYVERAGKVATGGKDQVPRLFGQRLLDELADNAKDGARFRKWVHKGMRAMIQSGEVGTLPPLPPLQGPPAPKPASAPAISPAAVPAVAAASAPAAVPAAAPVPVSSCS